MGTPTWRRFVSPCWSAKEEGGNSIIDEHSGRTDGLWWYKDIGNHDNGEFSMAIVQANVVIEDHCEVESGQLSFAESGPHGTFVGIYDGHGGPEASRFIRDHLFHNIKSMLKLTLTFYILCEL